MEESAHTLERAYRASKQGKEREEENNLFQVKQASAQSRVILCPV